jgi:hypothetical protein
MTYLNTAPSIPLLNKCEHLTHMSAKLTGHFLSVITYVKTGISAALHLEFRYWTEVSTLQTCQQNWQGTCIFFCYLRENWTVGCTIQKCQQNWRGKCFFGYLHENWYISCTASRITLLNGCEHHTNVSAKLTRYVYFFILTWKLV